MFWISVGPFVGSSALPAGFAALLACGTAMYLWSAAYFARAAWRCNAARGGAKSAFGDLLAGAALAAAIAAFLPWNMIGLNEEPAGRIATWFGSATLAASLLSIVPFFVARTE